MSPEVRGSVVAPLVVLAGLSFLAGITCSRAAQRADVNEKRVTREYQLVMGPAIEALGEHPLPRLTFLPPESFPPNAGRVAALTVCGAKGSPAIIAVNTEALRKDPNFMVYIGVPHEIAHALNCYTEGYSAGHGPAWKAAVITLVEFDRAEAIIEQQTHTEEEENAAQMAPQLVTTPTTAQRP